MFGPVNQWEDVKDIQDRLEWLENEVNSATGFCGCGNPEEAYRTLRNVLTILKVRNLKWELGVPHDVYLKGFWMGLDKTIGYHSHPGAATAYLYWIDHMDLTEHGGSVPGWLTTRGEIVLEWLNELCGLDNRARAEL